MTLIEIQERLTKAGNTYDGHVTNGSITEQMKIVQELLEKVCPAFYRKEE